MHRLLPTSAVLMLAIPGLVRADFKSGNTLLSTCNDNALMCLGYLEGVADVMLRNTINGFHACVPPGVLAGQVMDVATMYLAKNAQKRHLDAAGLVAQALEEAWPYPK